jgi:hypothetical protein
MDRYQSGNARLKSLLKKIRTGIFLESLLENISKGNFKFIFASFFAKEHFNKTLIFRRHLLTPQKKKNAVQIQKKQGICLLDFYTIHKRS